MSSQEDTKGGKPPDEPEPPDINLDSSSGPFNEPTPQAHPVSQLQGDTPDPISPATAEQDKTGSEDIQITVEARSTASQASDISSLDPNDTPVEVPSSEGQQGEAELTSSAIDPETKEAVQPPVSTADQIPATTTPSNLSQTANTLATTTTTQSVATTVTTSNIQPTIATISPASTPEKEAKSALPVPGLTDPGSEEQEAEQPANVSPETVVQTAIEDLYTAHSMSNLQLTDDVASEMDPKLENTISGGPGPQPLSSTPNRPLLEPPNNLNVSATTSSDQLGSTIHAGHESTMSLTGYDSASNIFHTDASSNIPAV